MENKLDLNFFEDFITTSSNEEKFTHLLKKVKEASHNIKGLSVSRLRNIFSETKDIYEKVNSGSENLYQLKNRLQVKLAYLAGRIDKKKNGKFFVKELEELLFKVNSKEKFHNFYLLIEAFVAYMKYFGKDN